MWNDIGDGADQHNYIWIQKKNMSYLAADQSLKEMESSVRRDVVGRTPIAKGF